MGNSNKTRRDVVKGIGTIATSSLIAGSATGVVDTASAKQYSDEVASLDYIGDEYTDTEQQVQTTENVFGTEVEAIYQCTTGIKCVEETDWGGYKFKVANHMAAECRDEDDNEHSSLERMRIRVEYPGGKGDHYDTAPSPHGEGATTRPAKSGDADPEYVEIPSWADEMVSTGLSTAGLAITRHPYGAALVAAGGILLTANNWVSNNIGPEVDNFAYFDMEDKVWHIQGWKEFTVALGQDESFSFKLDNFAGGITGELARFEKEYEIYAGIGNDHGDICYTCH